MANLFELSCQEHAAFSSIHRVAAIRMGEERLLTHNMNFAFQTYTFESHSEESRLFKLKMMLERLPYELKPCFSTYSVLPALRRSGPYPWFISGMPNKETMTFRSKSGFRNAKCLAILDSVLHFLLLLKESKSNRKSSRVQ